jgi:hypothetical protein
MSVKDGIQAHESLVVMVLPHDFSQAGRWSRSFESFVLKDWGNLGYYGLAV